MKKYHTQHLVIKFFSLIFSIANVYLIKLSFVTHLRHLRITFLTISGFIYNFALNIIFKYTSFAILIGGPCTIK